MIKIPLNLIEEIKIIGPQKSKLVRAKIDTGADKSSIDLRLAADLQLGPIIRVKKVKSAHGTRLRPIIPVKIKLRHRKIKEEFTVAERSHMKYPVLIGKNILKKGFTISF